MQVITNNTIDTVTRYTGVGLGNFDGLHIGHMALINTLISECKLHGLKSVVYTFIKHPDHMLRKALISPLITANEQKTQLLASTELDYLYYEEFDEEYSQLSPDEFIKNILMDKLKIKLAVVGFNYRFGYMGRGDSEYLKRAGKKLGFRVIVMPPVKVNAEIVSSTLIRSYIRRGKIDRVFQLLGRHFSLTGTVVCGRHIGRTLGFPTANILANPEMVIPANGVYITKTRLEGRWLNGITNVGVAPTVRGENIFSIETHLFEYEGDLYGKPIEVCFIQRLRGERKFENIAALKKQVAEDIEETRRYWEVLK
ncbi:MAG TPA: bifunctional riboflavin kinase/FMN adenylyltransferase [Ruminiclostridium sp.]|nr:bifunctional riboflavin kinase/FMN adenylyltransferase [Ruminiclostridium sp.]